MGYLIGGGRAGSIAREVFISKPKTGVEGNVAGF
jgi:hypothetical protein